MRSLLLQLADSAFPSGSFAHSFGLEGLRKTGHLRNEEQLLTRLRELVWSTAMSSCPFLMHAHQGDLIGADLACDAFLSSHVANRASRAQGAALLIAAEAAFDVAPALPHRHVAPAFGAVLASLGASTQEATQVFLFAALRGALSAAVRLGVVGPLRAQALLYGLHGVLDEALAATSHLTLDDAAHIAPLVDVCQGAQDRFYTRLFQS